MGDLHLLAEIDIPDTKDQQPPAGMEAHGTVAEVCVAAKLLGVRLVLIDVRTGVSACFCHSHLLAWGCWKQRTEGHLMRPQRSLLAPTANPGHLQAPVQRDR